MGDRKRQKVCHGRLLKVDALEICSKSGSHSGLLGGSVHRDENQVRLTDTLVDVGGEEKVAATAAANDILKARLVDGEIEVGAVPRVDAGFVEIDDGDGDVRAFECDDSASRSSCKDAFIQSSAFVRECRITNHL